MTKSKALGPIPDYFHAAGGELQVAGKPVTALIKQAGRTPLFVYDLDVVRVKIGMLRRAMPAKLGIHYAVKANPFAPLVKAMDDLVDGFDIASGGELELLAELCIDLSSVSFAGPGKREEEIAAAIRAGVTINLESELEAERALRIGRDLGRTPRLAVRVNPDFGLKGSGMKMGGGPRQFGVDASRVPDLVRYILDGGADWQGFHIFAGSQSLDADAIISTQEQTVALAASLAESVGVSLPRCNLGGGMGIPYFPGDTPIDVDKIGAALGQTLDNLTPILADTKFSIELGRYLVGEAGVYLTRIIDRKVSYGETFLITDGGLHHQLAASGNFGTVMRRNYPVAIATRFGSPAAETVNIVGCLCTPLDKLADKGAFPVAEPGDIVVVFCAGAYGASASPATFLSQGPALEILV